MTHLEQTTNKKDKLFMDSAKQKQKQNSKQKDRKSFLLNGSITKGVLFPRLIVITIVALLLFIGLIMVYSASSVEGYNDKGSASYFFIRQVIFVVIGCALAAAVIFATPKIWDKNVLLWLWIISIAMLAITLAAGFVGLGAKRWISIAGFTFQPSEFAKITVLLGLANIIIRYQIGELDGGIRTLIAQGGICVVIPVFFIIIQPDLGTTLVLLASVLAVLWFTEFNAGFLKWILIAIAVLTVLAILLQGFRSTRILAWLHPEADPDGYGYQSLNSYYAFSNGGFFGVGLGNSTQKYEYLTYAYNDFIFAIIGEEGGFLAVIVLMALYIALLFFSFRIGSHAQSSFGTVVCNASAVTIVFQAFLNMACVSGVLPVTGKPLPFISYGGSSMLSTMILVGIILSVSFKDSEDDHKRRKSIRSNTRNGYGRDQGRASAQNTRRRRNNGQTVA